MMIRIAAIVALLISFTATGISVAAASDLEATKKHLRHRHHREERVLQEEQGLPHWDPSLLPPGAAKEKYDSLPHVAREKVRNTFKASNLDARVDGQYINIDNNGGVIFVNPAPLVEEFSVPDGEFKNYPEDAPTQDSGVPIFHSKPGAPYTLYLDFDGAQFSNRAWAPNQTIDAQPYRIDGDYAREEFNAIELDIIGNSWAVVAEDFSPFDIDVTTETPNDLGQSNIGHVLVTDNKDKNDVTIYECECGGVAYLSSFGTTEYEFESPALVFNKGFVGISEAASHEFGHNLGLVHHGTNSDEYYTGHGSGETDWAPIMGVGYYAETTQWSKGEYADASAPDQNDLAIISSKIPFRQDDHPVGSETPLQIIDGNDGYGEGIIETSTDEDWFTFGKGGGISYTEIGVTTRSNRFGNLDAGFKLQSSDGFNLATVEPEDQKSASLVIDLPPGTYKIMVYGTGNGLDPSVGYSDYGSLGQYEVRATNVASGSASGSDSVFQETYSSTATPVGIPDGQSIEILVADVPNDGCEITDVNVRVNATHTWIGDLSFTLKHPSGLIVGLMDRPGFPDAGNFGYSASLDSTTLFFDDISTNNPEDLGAGGGVIVSQSVKSVGVVSSQNPQASATLTHLNNLEPDGNWTFKAQDHVGDFVGTIEEVKLILRIECPCMDGCGK